MRLETRQGWIASRSQDWALDPQGKGQPLKSSKEEDDTVRCPFSQDCSAFSAEHELKGGMARRKTAERAGHMIQWEILVARMRTAA